MFLDPKEYEVVVIMKWWSTTWILDYGESV